MANLKAWLQAANGWKRLWFVLTALGVLYCFLINPFVLSSKSSLSRYQYKWAVEKELKNPECQPFSKKPLSELTEPNYNNSEGREGCYHLYNYRHFHNQTTIPYTQESLDSDFTKEIWGELLTLSGVGGLIAGMLSATIYFLGWLVAWIVAGFSKKSL